MSTQNAVNNTITGNAATVTTIPALSGKITTTGSTNVTSVGTFNLDDLSDVTAPSSVSGDHLMFNGSAWVNMANPPVFVGTSSDFYLDTSTSVDSNLKLTSTPSIYSEVINTKLAVTAATTPVFFQRFVSNAVGVTSFPAGTWTMHAFAACSSIASANTIYFKADKRREQIALTGTYSGGPGFVRTFTMTSYAITGINTGTKTFTIAGSHLFKAGSKIKVTGGAGSNDGIYTVVSTLYTTSTDIVVTEAINSAVVQGNIQGAPFVSGDANANRLLCGCIETPTQTSAITAFTNESTITIYLTDSAFVNVTDASLDAIYYTLFNDNIGTLTQTGVKEYSKDSAQSEFTGWQTSDRLVMAFFAGSDAGGGGRDISLYYGGTAHYTSFHAPSRLLHNNLSGLNATGYKHLTDTEYTGTGTNNFVRETTPTITTPVIDSISISGSAIAAALWNTTLTTGSISMGGALTSGDVNIANGTTYSGTVNIASGIGVVTTARTLNLATGGTTAPTSINIGSTVAAGVTTVNSPNLALTKATATQSIGVTPTDGLLLTNTTAASNGAQQMSPRLHLHSQGWNTSANKAEDWTIDTLPVQAATANALLRFQYSYDGAAYDPMLTIGATGPSPYIQSTSGSRWTLFGGLSTPTVINTNWTTQGETFFEIANSTTTASDYHYSALNLSNTQTGTTNLIGAIHFVSTNSASTDKRLAHIAGYTDAATNSGQLRFYTTTTGTNSEKMRITKEGWVGINKTSSLDAMLDVIMTNAAYKGLRIQGAASQADDYLLLQSSTPATIFQVTSNGLVTTSPLALTAITAEQIHFYQNPGSVTITTGYTDQRSFVLAAPVLSIATANSITYATTQYIGGAPVNIGAGSITNAYALWVDQGRVRIDDSLELNGTMEMNGTIFDLTVNSGVTTGNANINLNDNLANALSIRESTNNYLTFVTTNNLEAVQLQKAVRYPYVAKTAIYTLTSADYIVDCTANTFTITLPTAVGRQGMTFIVKNSGTGVITIATTSSQTIDGSSTQTLNQYDAITVLSNNANWIII